jgi:hypothetical protein
MNAFWIPRDVAALVRQHVGRNSGCPHKRFMDAHGHYSQPELLSLLIDQMPARVSDFVRADLQWLHVRLADGLAVNGTFLL